MYGNSDEETGYPQKPFIDTFMSEIPRKMYFGNAIMIKNKGKGTLLLKNNDIPDKLSFKVQRYHLEDIFFVFIYYENCKIKLILK